MSHKISAVIPAHNEEERISKVLEVITKSDFFSEIIVVNDASKDNTKKIVKARFPKVKLVNKKFSDGKGAALMTGVNHARHELLFFCDADLINLKKYHLEQLITPVLDGKFRMTVGAQEYMNPLKKHKLYIEFKRLFKNFGGDGRPHFTNFLKGMGGQRVLYKSDILKIKNIKNSRYGVEQEINYYFMKNDLKYKLLILKDVEHYAKVEKWGLLNGLTKDSDYVLSSTYHLLRQLKLKLLKSDSLAE